MDTSATSVLEALLTRADSTPARPLLHFEGEAWTYGDLAARVRAFARGLLARGLAPGERVALYLENAPGFLVAYFGVQQAGGVAVLVNPAYRQVELGHILADAGVRACVTGGAGARELAGLVAQLPALALLVLADGEAPSGLPWPAVTLEALLAEGEGDARPLALPAGDALAVLGYTSGTTGRSKGAMMLQRNLLSNARAVVEAWRWTEGDRLLLTLPLFHTHGLMVGVHGTLVAGASLELHRKFTADGVLDRLGAEPALTMFFGVPTMYGRLVEELEKRGTRPRALRLLVSGSAPLPPQLFHDVEALWGQRILERYGMTETVMNTTNPYDGERRAGTVGLPFPGQEARVVNVRTRSVQPAGEPGEIEVRGPHVFAGYWNNPAATREAFSDGGWFRTGDLGQTDPDGYLRITGRARELIITGGFNVYPREVEEVLLGHPDVAEVAVLGMPHADYGEQVVACVVPREGARPTAEALQAHCREQLAAFKKPREVHLVASLPRNALGKVQKHLLRERLESAGSSR